MQQHELIPHLFRTEYSKIVAVLCHSFDLKHLEIAEDIASDTFLKAAETWGIKGVPENPAAWLYAVAKNKTKDYFRHNAVREKQVKETIRSNNVETEPDFEFTHQNIADSQLSMIFSVCDGDISPDAQICLALQILCGFSVEEIANAFLTNLATVKKRLQRARAVLRNGNFHIKTLVETEIKTRSDNVLKTLYLLFNEGYFSKTNNQLIRKDLCSEAIRLTSILVGNALTNTPQTNALLALMYFQSSRFDARTDEIGEVILLEDQDKSLWDNELIERGNHYLVNAFHGNEVSKYHLEAAIAYWHTTPTPERKWENILTLYNQLILIEYSPVTALNRTFAFAKVYGTEKGIQEAEKLHLNNSSPYHSLLGYLYANLDIDKSIDHYEQAIALTNSRIERQTLTKEVERLKRR
ncbi:RNA polymerase sigma factor [Puia dinghuensis]|uniref:DNA-directed RNA polymerase sigma-70 factor n=1 Tax=Puia dinghuensis TaxID=1792502 RepID=A0A8J2UBX1_9BACT|nr:sigma-70 family RNA polymerase sigma factor [Puia dinghuensis]GGA96066.1 DNA-directed RNA polymerase sigma-70 factor [Puia dinghuensis]